MSDPIYRLEPNPFGTITDQKNVQFLIDETDM